MSVVPRYEVDPASGCWNYLGHVRRDGRAGCVWRNGKQVSAYVAGYEIAKGEIPAGTVLDHLCRNPRCINPEHLEPVSQAINARRGTHTRLTEAQAAEIRLLPGPITEVTAAEYGVNRRYLYHVRSGRKWSKSPRPHLRGAK